MGVPPPVIQLLSTGEPAASARSSPFVCGMEAMEGEEGESATLLAATQIAKGLTKVVTRLLRAKGSCRPRWKRHEHAQG